MTDFDSHPSPDRLAAFAAGDLTFDELAAVESHLEACEACCTALEAATPADPFVAGLRSFGRVERVPANGTPKAGQATADTAPLFAPVEAAGTVLAGRYRLREPLGVGGMGTVWAADQTAPVRRTVAVKVIKAGLGGPAVLRRFEAERQALALMDHPNIARVLEGGETPDGRPFFVMELVAGRRITDYCDAARLDVRGRLELFVAVCRAVQHAHQKGIVHRDLKPSNVLIATVDGQPVPKVIDFGIAKATAGTLTEATLDTGVGAIIGTPHYMSPEQATFDNPDIDTRADVYSLGVLLYELLCGSTPFALRELEGKDIFEVLRAVREVDPPRPSAKLSAAETLPEISAERGTEPKLLANTLRNELDWIVMKALEKDRARRYESASSLAADVGRYLGGEPVLAHPPSAVYRFGKFLRRNKGPAVAVGLVAAALVLGMAGTTYGMILARESAAAADVAKQQAERDRDAKELARREEERQHRYAQAIAEFVRNDFLGLMSVEGQDRYGGTGKDELNRNTTLGQLLDRAAAKLRARSDLDPRTEAELNLIVGINYRSAGEAKKGLEFLEKAVRLRTDQLGRDHRDTLGAMNSLGAAYAAAGRLDKAVALHDETLERRTAALGPDDRDTLTSMSNLAGAYYAVGKRELALPLLEKALDLKKTRLGPDDPLTLTDMGRLASAYQDAGKRDLAVRLFEESFNRLKATRGPGHHETLAAMDDLADAYRNAGDFDRAGPLFVEALRLTTAKHGPDHPSTLTVAIRLGGFHLEAGQIDRAIPIFEGALKVATAKFDGDHPTTLAVMNNLALAYDRANKLDRAVPLFEETLKLKMAKLGPDHPDTLLTQDSLAKAYWRGGQFDKAVAQFEAALKLKEAKHGRGHVTTQLTLANLAVNYREAGRPADALPLFEEAYRASKQHAELRWIGRHLLGAYAKAGDAAKFDELLREQLRDARNTLPTESPQLAARLGQLGGIVLDQGRWAEAESLLREGLAIREATEPKAGATFYAKSMVGVALLGQKKFADAEPLLRAGYEGMMAGGAGRSAQGRTILKQTATRLVELYDATNRPGDAAKWRTEREQIGKP